MWATPVAAASAARSTRVRRAEHPLERPGVLRRALLQQPEDPAAAVVEHDDRQVRARLVRADHEAGGVVQQRQVAEQRVRRSVVGQRRADRRRHRAVDPRDPPVGQHRDVGPRRRRERDVADRVRRADDEQRAAGQRLHQARASRRPPGAAGSSSAASSALAAAASASSQLAVQSPATGAIAARPPTARTVPATSGQRGPPASARAYTATSGSASSRWTGRCRVGRPGHDHLRRPQLVRERAEQPRTGAQTRRPTPPTRVRRPPAGPTREPAAGAPAPATTSVGAAGSSGSGADLDLPTRHGGPRPPAGPTVGRLPGVGGTSGSAKGRFTCTGPGGVPSAAATARSTAARHDAVLPLPHRAATAGLSASRTASPKIPGWTIVWFAPVPIRLRRPVSREHQQRHAGVGRLQHGRVQVRDGRPRRRHHRHRPAGPQRQAEREEAGGALVDPHVQPQAPRDVRVVQRERERRAARSRAQDGVGDPAADQLVDDHLRVRRRGIHCTEASPKVRRSARTARRASRPAGARPPARPRRAGTCRRRPSRRRAPSR